MKYLDYDILPDFLKEYFNSPDEIAARRVGIEQNHDSGYFDIVRFFGTRAVNPKEVPVRYLPEPFTFRDPLIRKYAQEIAAEMHRAGRLFHGPLTMKVAEADLHSPPYFLKVQPCSYDDQAGSCFALDYPHRLFHGKGETLRQYYKRTYPSKELRDNPLAICLGVCGLVLTGDGERLSFLLVHRSAHLASLENSVGPSVAGAVDFKKGYRNLHELLLAAVSEELTEELALQPEEYTVTPLAYAREIFRGERPQLFCAIHTALSEEALSKRLAAISGKREFDSFRFVPLGKRKRVPEKAIHGLNHEARMNYYLLEEYLHSPDYDAVFSSK